MIISYLLLIYPVVWLTIEASLQTLQPASFTPRSSRLSVEEYDDDHNGDDDSDNDDDNNDHKAKHNKPKQCTAHKTNKQTDKIKLHSQIYFKQTSL